MKNVYILIRYSILTDSGSAWVIGRKNESNYKEKLFDSSRLNNREFFFKNDTIPSLIQISKNLPTKVALKIIVLTSEELPSYHLDRLKKICSNLSNCTVETIKRSENYTSFFEDLVRKDLLLKGETGIYATIRLDDDDCLSSRFIFKLNNYLKPSFSGYCVTFPLGYKSYYNVYNTIEGYDENYKPLLAQGLSYIDTFKIKNKKTKTIYSVGNHRKVDRKVPVVMDSSFHAYIWAIHRHSDLSLSTDRSHKAETLLAKFDIEGKFHHLKK